MPPRKPKLLPVRQHRRRLPPRRQPLRAAPSYNKDTHILGDDGKLYEKKVVSGAATAVRLYSDRCQRRMRPFTWNGNCVETIHKAHADGLADQPEKIREKLLAVRDEHLKGR